MSAGLRIRSLRRDCQLAKTLLFVLALCVVVLSTANSAFAQGSPNLSHGISPNSIYSSGNIDNVSVFNGALSMAIPIGLRYPVGGNLSYGLTLTYNNNVWDFVDRDYNGQTYTEAVAAWRFNAGLGWQVSLGQLWHPGYAYNNTGEWLYLSPDGGMHVLYQQLHHGESDGDDYYMYTRDGSYIRMRSTGFYWRYVETPDGLIRTFVKTGGEFKLTKIQDRFGNWVQIDYSAEGTDGELWTITDSQGRTQYVHTQNMHWIGQQIQSIDLSGPNGTRMVYTFNYWEQKRHRSFKDTYPLNSDRITLPLLTALVLPDGSKYQMLDAGQPAYYDGSTNGMYDLPGMISKITLPTGGSITYDYQRYDFPGGPLSYYNSATGMKTRTVYNADGSVVGAWTYKTVRDTTHQEMITHVVQPTGDCTKYYFTADPNINQSAKTGWDYGLPYTTRFTSGGRNLSSVVYSSSYGTGCSGTALRATYLNFEHDKLDPSPSGPGDWYATNRRVSGSRTVFGDDNSHYIDTAFSTFDGLGHYRTSTTTGDFRDDLGTTEQRTTTIDFNPGRGNYPNNGGGSYVPLTTSEPWVINTFDYRESTDNAAVGESTMRMEATFDTATGALQCSRVLKSGTSRSAQDLLTQLTRDGNGNVTEAALYGGDVSPIGTGSGCVGSGPSYATELTYQYGVANTARARGKDGSLQTFLSRDLDIDPSTGLVLVSRSPNGISTSYSYDSMARVTQVSPSQGPVTTYTYTPASGSSGPMIAASVSSGATTFSQSQVVYDGLGRAIQRRQNHPDKGWIESDTTYNSRGWPLTVTVPGNPGAQTEYLNYDAFGRPGTIRPPDGASHDILLSYEGIRHVTRQTKVGTTSGETYTRQESFSDSFGRTWKVLQPAAPDGSDLVATYNYDVAGRLSQVLLDSPSAGVQQTRAFTYDNRGFLQSEQHPEKGVSGNGQVLYSNYDAAGHPGQVIDGTSDLLYVYDPFGRLLQLLDGANGNRIVKEFTYDTASGLGVGKMAQAVQHNYVELPWEQAGEQDVTVTSTFAYQGIAGALSGHTTQVSRGNLQFTDGYAYDDAGELTSLTYPSCDTGTCTSDATPRTVGYGYQMGFLRSVGGYTTGTITYHASGLWESIPHANGVTDHQEADPFGMGRTHRLYTTGASNDWDSGDYLYDGSGNIVQMGTTSFVYDGAGRLAGTGQLTGGSWDPGDLFEAGIATGITDAWSSIPFSANFSAPPFFLADTDTYAGSDTGTLRRQQLSSNSVQVMFQEETSDDPETTHGNAESAGYVAVSDQSLPPSLPIEVGTVSIPDGWTTVQLTKSFTDPIIVAGPATQNGSSPVTLRVRNITPTSFEIQLSEWSYDNGSHNAEDVHWMAVERGRWDLPSGGTVEAGTTPAQGRVSGSPVWTGVSYSQPLNASPAVLTLIASNNESDPATTRLQNVSTSGFEVYLEEERASTGEHAQETVDWVAWEPGVGTNTGPQIDFEEQYTYDTFGNMTSITHTWPDGTDETRTFAIVPSTNRLSAASYDTSGDLVSGGTGTYQYDAVHNLQAVSFPTWIYLYDAFNERIATFHNAGGGMPVDETYTVRRAGGKVLREYARSDAMTAGELNWMTDYVWRGSGLLATVRPGANGDLTTHYHLDHLGSPRLVTDDAGQTLSRHTYFPYGTEATDPSDPQQASFRMQFTGHERDLMGAGTLDDLDYMHARSYSPHMGRFLQIDPVLGSVGNPQSWNRYAYVWGNPINFTDPTGQLPGWLHKLGRKILDFFGSPAPDPVAEFYVATTVIASAEDVSSGGKDSDRSDRVAGLGLPYDWTWNVAPAGSVTYGGSRVGDGGIGSGGNGGSDAGGGDSGGGDDPHPTDPCEPTSHTSLTSVLGGGFHISYTRYRGGSGTLLLGAGVGLSGSLTAIKLLKGVLEVSRAVTNYAFGADKIRDTHSSDSYGFGSYLQYSRPGSSTEVFRKFAPNFPDSGIAETESHAGYVQGGASWGVAIRFRLTNEWHPCP